MVCFLVRTRTSYFSCSTGVKVCILLLHQNGKKTLLMTDQAGLSRAVGSSSWSVHVFTYLFIYLQGTLHRPCRRMIASNWRGGEWNKSVAAMCNVMSWQSPEQTEKNHKEDSVGILGAAIKIRTRHFPNTIQKRYYFGQLARFSVLTKRFRSRVMWTVVAYTTCTTLEYTHIPS